MIFTILWIMFVEDLIQGFFIYIFRKVDEKIFFWNFITVWGVHSFEIKYGCTKSDSNNFKILLFFQKKGSKLKINNIIKCLETNKDSPVSSHKAWSGNL